MIIRGRGIDMKVKKVSLKLFCSLGLLAGHLLYADSTSSAPNISTSTSDQSVWQKISEKAVLNYFGVYRGGPLSDIKNSLQPDIQGNLSGSNPQSIDNLVTTGYKIDKDSYAALNTHFYYYPVGNPVGNGQDLQMWDPSLVYNRSNLINSNGFKLTGRVNLFLPLTSVDLLQTQHQLTSMDATFIANYDVPHTALTVGLFGYVRGYIPKSDAIATARTYKIYLAPNANYQITKTVAATLWVDLLQITRNRGTGFISGMSNYTVDIEPGINWDITNKISFNPILNIYPSNPTLAATSIQAILVAKAF